MGLFTIDIYQLHVPFWTTSLSCESLQENCHFLANFWLQLYGTATQHMTTTAVTKTDISNNAPGC